MSKSEGGFFDNIITKIKKGLDIDDNPYALFDDKCVASGFYPAPPNVIAASDIHRLIQEVSTLGAHTPPRHDLQRMLDETFAEIAAATLQLESVLQLERGTTSRARSLLESSTLLNKATEKEVRAVDSLVRGSLRCKFQDEEKEEGDDDKKGDAEDAKKKSKKTRRPTLLVYGKWASGNEEAVAEGLKQVESEKAEWERIIHDLEAPVEHHHGHH